MASVRYLSLSAGPEGVFAPGAVREVNSSRAKELVDGGFAVLVAPETATAEPRETTAAPAPEKRKK